VNELTIYTNLIVGWFILAAIVFISLFFFAAPYGRHIRSGWGPVVNNHLGWVIMEMTAPVLFFACFVVSNSSINAVTLIFLGIWEAHYLHRAFIYPFSLRGGAKRMPVVVMGFGFVFNMINGYLNGRYIFTLSDGYTISWLTDPRFIIGMTLFIAGYIINRQADDILKRLREPGETGYRIPYGSLYHWISCPNYLGEILTWLGWAVATWSLSGFAFLVWTIANLVPRARMHHRWYKEQFPDYPERRKALLPVIW